MFIIPKEVLSAIENFIEILKKNINKEGITKHIENGILKINAVKTFLKTAVNYVNNMNLMNYLSYDEI